jgi:uncharacterized protein YjfI (DUF2170 family)
LSTVRFTLGRFCSDIVNDFGELPANYTPTLGVLVTEAEVPVSDEVLDDDADGDGDGDGEEASEEGDEPGLEEMKHKKTYPLKNIGNTVVPRKDHYKELRQLPNDTTPPDVVHRTSRKSQLHQI